MLISKKVPCLIEERFTRTRLEYHKQWEKNGSFKIESQKSLFIAPLLLQVTREQLREPRSLTNNCSTNSRIFLPAFMHIVDLNPFSCEYRVLVLSFAQKVSSGYLMSRECLLYNTHKEKK